MVNYRLGAPPDRVTSLLQTPAQVYCLNVSKKVCVKPSGMLPMLLFDEKRRPTGPKDIAGMIVLAIVFFQYMQHATPAEWKAVTIDKPSGRAGMLKMVTVIIRSYLWLGNCHIGITFQHFNYRSNPIGWHFYVLVKHHKVIGFYRLQYLVVSPGKSEVKIVLYDADGRVDGTDKFNRVVG